jgi:hypothetical protein
MAKIHKAAESVPYDFDRAKSGEASGEWIVELRGDHQAGSYEISVIREFCWERCSWGVQGKNKFIVAQCGPGCRPLSDYIFNETVNLACKIADELNGGGTL